MVEEHPLLPTKEQCQLMDEFVQGMDLDAYAARHADHENVDEDDKDIVMERYVPLHIKNRMSIKSRC